MVGNIGGRICGLAGNLTTEMLTGVLAFDPEIFVGMVTELFPNTGFLCNPIGLVIGLVLAIFGIRNVLFAGANTYGGLGVGGPRTKLGELLILGVNPEIVPRVSGRTTGISGGPLLATLSILFIDLPVHV